MSECWDPLTGEPVEPGSVAEERPAPAPAEGFDPLTGEPLPACPDAGDDAPGDEEAGEDFDPVTGEDLPSAPACPAPAVPEGGIADALKGMVSFFTVIRLPVGMREYDAMERMFWLAPAAGALVGLVAFIVCTVLGLCGLGTLVQSAFALASAYMFSKFLHFDGLTDFGDGMICSSGSREKHVKALKDTLVGAGGVGVAIMTVLITFVLYGSAASAPYAVSVGSGWVSLNVAFLAFGCEILVKNAQVAAAAFGEPGNGMASRQVGATTIDSMIRSTALSAVLIAVVMLIFIAVSTPLGMRTGTDIGMATAILAISLAVSVLTGWWMARTANANFGFVNGDILGATNEISRATILLSIALMVGVFLRWRF